jgi:LEA14-like dessication related protein
MSYPFFRVVFFLFALLATGCASLVLDAEPPEVLVTNITPLEATLFEQQLKVDIRVRNPNPFELNVTGLDFTLNLNGKRLARGLANRAVTIPRLGDAIVSVNTTTSTLEVMRQLLSLHKQQDMKYHITGVLHLDGTRLPFDTEGVIFDASQLPSSNPEP